MTDENKFTLEALNKKVDAVIDHTATQLGKLEAYAVEKDAIIQNLSERLYDFEQSAKPDRSAIYSALAKAQLEIRNAEKNVDNDFTKKPYADIASVLDAVREPLAKNGIALFQMTADISTSMLGIRTVLAHGESGQTIEDLITMSPPKLDPQGIGSCRTYMRRYAILALCAIAGANDDDAEATLANANDYARITTAQAEKIYMKADELFGDRADAAVAKMLNRLFNGITNIGDIKEGEHDTALNALGNAKELMDKAEAKAKQAEKVAKAEAKENGK